MSRWPARSGGDGAPRSWRLGDSKHSDAFDPLQGYLWVL